MSLLTSKRRMQIACESLEPRTMFSIVVHINNDLVPAGYTIGATHPAYVDFGFFRQGSAGDARSISYNVRNQGGTNLHVTDVTVPAGFIVVSKPGPTADLPPDDFDENLTVRMDKNLAGHHQGNIVVHGSDGSTFAFEITG